MVPVRREVGDEPPAADRPGREAGDAQVAARRDEQQREPDRADGAEASGRRALRSSDDHRGDRGVPGRGDVEVVDARLLRRAQMRASRARATPERPCSRQRTVGASVDTRMQKRRRARRRRASARASRTAPGRSRTGTAVDWFPARSRALAREDVHARGERAWPACRASRSRSSCPVGFWPSVYSTRWPRTLRIAVRRLARRVRLRKTSLWPSPSGEMIACGAFRTVITGGFVSSWIGFGSTSVRCDRSSLTTGL